MSWEHDKKRGNRHERGYGTLWYKLRDAVMQRDSHICQPCLEKDRLTPATEVDHIIPKSQGGTDNPDNLQAICTPCHKDKTQVEQGKSIKQPTNLDGTPHDPTHPWNS